MRDKITTFVKGTLSDDIIAQLLKDFEMSEGKPFFSKITLRFNVSENIEAKIEKASIQIAKTKKSSIFSEKIEDPEVFDFLINHIESKKSKYKESWLRILRVNREHGEVCFPNPKEEAKNGILFKDMLSLGNLYLLFYNLKLPYNFVESSENNKFSLYKKP
jgi:hypothetical protein